MRHPVSFRFQVQKPLSLLLAGAALAAATLTAAAELPAPPDTSVAARTRPEVLLSARVREGVFTVDGLVGKIRLNYEIRHAEYLYLYVPGTGTAVLSAQPMTNSLPVTLGRDGMVRFSFDGHQLMLSGIEQAATVDEQGRTISRHPQQLWVSIDRSRAAQTLARTPMVGYGSAESAPYAWPAALATRPDPLTDAPPMPRTVLPQQAIEVSSLR